MAFWDGMLWEDERYVRVFTRDTADWLALSFDAQSLYLAIERKVNRAGILQLGRQGKRAVAVAIGHAHLWSRLEPALEELLADGCVQVNGDVLVLPDFLVQQETPQSDRARKRAERERAAARAVSQNVTPGHTALDSSPPVSQIVTQSHEPSHDVTPGHAASLRAVPYRADPVPCAPRDARPVDRFAAQFDATPARVVAAAVRTLNSIEGKEWSEVQPPFVVRSVHDALAAGKTEEQILAMVRYKASTWKGDRSKLTPPALLGDALANNLEESRGARRGTSARDIAAYARELAQEEA
jgi:hypothetical protein